MEQMKQWHIKEFSELTGVTVRTLHHYDRIGLLRPTMRSTNGYRWYTTTDLVTLQQIIALKFFGFSLSQIKTMLQQQPSMLEHLLAQQQMLNDQVVHLQQAQAAMATLVTQLSSTGSFDWQHLTTLIERYRMTQELKNTWAGKAFNEQQLAAYIALRKQYPQAFAALDNLNQEINNLNPNDAEGKEGMRIAKAFIDLMAQIETPLRELGKINPELLADVRSGKLTELPLTPQGSLCLSRAMLAYGLQRWNDLYHEIKKEVNQDPTGGAGKHMASAWRALVKELACAKNTDLIIGTMQWHTMQQQQDEVRGQSGPLTHQQVVNKIKVPLFLDTQAMHWIEAALNAH